jgi:hypothetical protein
VQAGRSSPPTRSDGPVLTPTTQAGPPAPAMQPQVSDPVPARVPDDADTSSTEASRPTRVRAVRLGDGAVEVSWAGPRDAEFRVRVRTGPESWRVVGRTRATSIEDGGTAPGELPVYAVSATVDGVRSPEGRSDE